jgi:hypothetical protein
MRIPEFITNCNFVRPVFLRVGVDCRFVDFMSEFDASDAEVYEFNSESEADLVHLDSLMSMIDTKCLNLLWMPETSLKYLESSDTLLRTEYLCLTDLDPSLTDDILAVLPGKWMVRLKEGSTILFENVDYRAGLIGSNGAWTIKNLNEHVFDDSLASAFVNLFKINDVKNCVDFGCGPGKYVEYFNANGIPTVGYDGNPYTEELTAGKCHIIDLSVPFDLRQTFDCVMSLEVGEHIPMEFQETYIDNLVKHAGRFIVISWAIPGQDGYGHVNNRTNEYIREAFKTRGFSCNEYMDNILRLTADNTWFGNTVMTFRRIEK